MRILVAGASGVLGGRLIPLLTGAGHEVVGLVRPTSPRGGALSAQMGVDTVPADLLDPPAVFRAVWAVRPDAVIHLATAIPSRVDPRRLAKQFTFTNRLRTEGTRNLLLAAREAGAAKLITESVAYAYEPSDGGLADEDAPWWTAPPRQFAPVLAALQELERLTAEFGGVALRLGHLYGPGTSYAPDGSFIEQLEAGKLRIVGGGTATFSFTHVDDVASAVAAALDRDVSGALNIVDDDPIPLRDWLPHVARLLGAPEPQRVPSAVARLTLGGWGVAFMNSLRGADNSRARLRLDWRPRYMSWCDGFAAELRAATRTAVQ